MSRRERSDRVGFLVEFNYKPSTRKKYAAAVLQFLDWCDSSGDTAETYDDLDDLLFDYLHHLYVSGQGQNLGISTLYGLIMYEPRVRDHLVSSRLALRGWAKHCPPTSYPPLTWELTVLLCIYLIRHNQYRAGIALLLAFDCLLRIGEVAQLRREDVVEPGDVRVGAASSGVWLRLRHTKTGRDQLVQVLNPHVASLLHDLVRATPPRASLVGVSADWLRRLFKHACADVGLSAAYVPHSLRHGGATYLYMRGWTIESILVRGRWASVKSARTYIQGGRAALMSMQVPLRLGHIASVLAQHLLLAVRMSLSQEHGVGAGQGGQRSEALTSARLTRAGAARLSASALSSQ